MKLFKIVLLITAVNSLYAKGAIKEAFLEGINETIKVMTYEKSSQSKSIPMGYCIQLKAKRGVLKDSEIIKMESLALYFKLKPAFLKSQDQKKLCLSIAKDEITARKIVSQLKKDYPKITGYVIKVEVLSPFNYHREIPAIGLGGEDYKPSKVSNIILKHEEHIVFKTEDVLVKDSKIKNLYIIEDM